MHFSFVSILYKLLFMPSLTSPPPSCKQRKKLTPYFFSLAFHEVSVYPKKELPFFILFTAGLCSFTALLALLTHQYPEPMGIVAKAVSIEIVLWNSTYLFKNRNKIYFRFAFSDTRLVFLAIQLFMGQTRNHLAIQLVAAVISDLKKKEKRPWIDFSNVINYHSSHLF